MVDKRHIKRIEIIQELYASYFNPDTHISERAQSILKRIEELDVHIKNGAPKYSIDQIARVDLSILRLALYELLIEKTEPPKVIINEAVELAHDLGGEKSPGFINAVLGKIYREKLEIDENIENTSTNIKDLLPDTN